MKRWALLAGPWLLLAGCSTISPSGYYWGRYSDTLADLKKDRNGETIEAHSKQLEDILLQSKKRELKPPPGVQAELGYWFMEAGNAPRGLQLMEGEIKVYPESKMFISKVLKDK